MHIVEMREAPTLGYDMVELREAPLLASQVVRLLERSYWDWMWVQW